MKKKLVTIMLTAALAASAFTGCGQNAKSTPTASSSKAAEASSAVTPDTSSATSSQTETVDAEGFRILAQPETVSPTAPVNVRMSPGLDADPGRGSEGNGPHAHGRKGRLEPGGV